jgi:peroxiredoxin family protein
MDNEISKLTQKIKEGIDLSFSRLVIEKAKNNGELIFCDTTGNIMRVKAKDLLAKI